MSITGSLVTLFDPNDENAKNVCEWQTISLPHPSTDEIADFILLTAAVERTNASSSSTQQQSQKLQHQNRHHHLYEIQSLEQKYGSYFLGSHVLKDGTLYVATRMDPLFFVLHYLTTQSSAVSNKWQPLDQLNIPSIIQMTLRSKKQLAHLCQVNNQLGNVDDDHWLLYKLSNEKVLEWLTRKQERAHSVLMKAKLKTLQNRHTSGSVVSTKSEGFHLLVDEKVPTTMTIATMTTTAPLDTSVAGIADSRCDLLSALEQTTIYHHSIQVVCEYLSPEWRAKFLNHLGQSMSSLTISKTAIQEENVEEKLAVDLKKRAWEENILEDESAVTKKMKAGAHHQSVGLKRLQKVSTKGMKSISNFFGGKK